MGSMTTAAAIDSLDIDFLNPAHVQWTNADAIAEIERARRMADNAGRANFIFCAALDEWGVGDEYTSEAARRLVLALDATGKPIFERAAFIRRHRLDDMCPIHLVDLDRDGVCCDCDEEG